MEGWFVVSPDPQNDEDIHFQLKANLQGEPPETQLKLKSEVESTLSLLRVLYAQDKASLRIFLRQLISLAQAGLVGAHAQPEVAMRALASLRADVVAREGGRIKNRYMRELGRYALAFCGIPLVAYVLFHLAAPEAHITGFMLLWVGCMAGVWLSYGYRKTTIGFADLAIPESDRLDPPLRLFFAGLLTLVFGLLLYKNVVSIEIAGFKTQDIGVDQVVALLVGVLCGISELVLPAKMAKKAEELIGA